MRVKIIKLYIYTYYYQVSVMKSRLSSFFDEVEFSIGQ